jgi:hypothetical protein
MEIVDFLARGREGVAIYFNDRDRAQRCVPVLSFSSVRAEQPAGQPIGSPSREGRLAAAAVPTFTAPLGHLHRTLRSPIMADQSTTYRATLRPAEELTEEGKRWNHKLTAKVDTRGLRWATEVSLEGQLEVTILRLEPSEQPLTGLYEALTRELHVDEMAAAVRLTTDVEVRAMNAKGKPSKRFEALFPPVLVYRGSSGTSR